MTLDQTKRGQKVMIKAIPHDIVRAQAIRFGIAEGAIVTCEEMVPAGPVVVSKSKQEIAIGRKLAKDIQVEILA